MQRRAAALIALVVLGLASAGCSNDSDGKDASATTTDTPTTTSAAAVTTKPVTPTTKLPSGPANSPEAAAKGLLSSWEKGDRDGASRFARQAAINEIFSHPNTGDVTYDDQGCVPEGGTFLCSWTYPGGVMQMSVEGVLGTSGFVVDRVSYRAD